MRWKDFKKSVELSGIKNKDEVVFTEDGFELQYEKIKVERIKDGHYCAPFVLLNVHGYLQEFYPKGMDENLLLQRSFPGGQRMVDDLVRDGFLIRNGNMIHLPEEVFTLSVSEPKPL